MITLSHRSNSITQSEIRAMSNACRAIGGLNLSQGVCDTETPAAVIEGAKEAIDTGFNSYTRSDGITTLRNAIALKEASLKGVHLNPEEEICVSSGATGALYSALMAVLDPGDEVVLFEPFYGYHKSTLEALDLKINYVRLEAPEWMIDREALEAAMTPKTRAILINTPGNPSGKVFCKAELDMLAEVCHERDLVLFSDEIYEYFVYGERKHLSPIALPALRDRTIVIGGFSKTFSITGWRVGYTLAPAAVSEVIKQMSDLVYVCAPSPAQTGVAEGILTLPASHYEQLCADHLKKRDMICASLKKAGFPPIVPDGSYYVLADMSAIPAESSRARAIHFLEKTGVAGVPGAAFYHDDAGDHLIRFCYAKELSEIEDACRRIESYEA